MITLCGMPLSNYYNKVKMALLEKGVPFQEEVVRTGRSDDEVLSASPLAKIPFVRTPHGPLCESVAILEYLEAAHPTPPLLPADPYAAAKVRELMIFTNLHVELVARELYAQAFFGGTVSENTQARVRKQLDKNIPAFKRLAKFAPYAAGEQFTMADCAAYVNLPLVALSTRLVLGTDLLAEHGVDWKGYGKLVGQRPSAQRVDADRKADQEKLAAARKA
ncbi:glutathione S-transferase [Azohydromonas sp.]|uniref:glutathione S-transferase family protein n=1 Tax=Azohydromonas sp. TaxID=1872666 RepID=UPI002B84FCEA|nr:glutathione S-transferase [Azohydromonas sp.]HMM84755.1 glutathione S-transferase [Azohydromonas sp.]